MVGFVADPGARPESGEGRPSRPEALDAAKAFEAVMGERRQAERQAAADAQAADDETYSGLLAEARAARPSHPGRRSSFLSLGGA